MKRTPLVDLWLLVEAFCLMAAFWLALKVLPLSKLAGWLRSPVGSKKETLGRARWAILAVNRRLPKAFVCFPQSLAAHAMLRWRGIASVLHYGVNRSATNQLQAHTWLMVGDVAVVGGEAAPEFTVVSTFP